MTYGDIMAQILSEVTDKPKDQVDDLLEEFKKRFPVQYNLDEEVPPEKAEQLLDSLRKEKSGILAWLVRGGMLAGEPQGHA